MHLLLPPSETKRSGGVGISLGERGIPKDSQPLVKALIKLSSKPEQARKALGLGVKGSVELERNLELLTSGTMPAIERYTGVLFDALDYSSLSAPARELASKSLWIQSSLFGLVSADEPIPYYRLSASSKLPGISLKQHWSRFDFPLRGTILDMRSKAYAELMPAPASDDNRYLEVVGESGKALNHFNKRAKGLFTRAILEGQATDFAGLAAAAESIGCELSKAGTCLVLKVPATI